MKCTSDRSERYAESAQWNGGRFRDTLPREDPKGWSVLREYLSGKHGNRTPDEAPPILRRTAEEFAKPPASGLRVTWLGHSSSLIEIGGARVLLDPVFGDRVSPLSFVGPKRFHAPPMRVADLPPLNAVLVSHDHYDHLDRPTILELAHTGVPFVVPLGVGEHLKRWGIDEARITELDWWQTHSLGDIEVVATPARHFSGRCLTMTDRDKTLWSGWALLGNKHRLYFTGDTAMFPGFEEIGAQLGPFDVALVEAGAYNPLWRDVHIGPEQAVLACQFVKSELLLPVHWGTFDLSLHPWTEPIERILAAARHTSVDVLTPRLGQSVEPTEGPTFERWWPELPWNAAQDQPIVSSGLDATIEARIAALGAPA